MSKKTKKGPHPHDKKERQQIAGCPRCRGKEVVTPPAQETEPAPPVDVPPRVDAALVVLPLSSVPLESEPTEEPESPPVVPEGFSPH